MKASARGVVLIVMLLAFSGCVTSHYKNDKGCECTRRYFTILGIPTHSCSNVCQSVAEPATTQGKELKIASAAPAQSPRQNAQARAMAQSIKATTQALR